jgi:hypothetical protein
MHYGRTAPHPGPLPIGWGEGEWLVATRCRATRGLSSKNGRYYVTAHGNNGQKMFKTSGQQNQMCRNAEV